MPHPTPLADGLADIATSVEAGGLLYSAARLTTLAGQVAKLERFHAEVTAEAAAEELLHPGVRPTAHSDFLASFQRDWGQRPC